MLNILEKVLKSFINSFGRLMWKVGSSASDYDDVILITGSPRSGTTWLLELLEGMSKKNRQIWEPFMAIHDLPEKNTQQRIDKINSVNLNHGLRPYINPDVRDDEFQDFFESIIFGRADIPLGARMGEKQRNSKYKIIKAVPGFRHKTTIVKFVRAQRLLPWINKNLPIKSIFIIRHPLAVVASQLHKNAFQHEGIAKEHPILSENVLKDYPEMANYSRSLETVVEKLAATWCFDNLIPLEYWKHNEGYYLISYEQLVTEPFEQLEKMENALNVNLTKETYKQINTPSVTTVSDSNVKKNKDPLTTWQKRLSAKQTDKILKVVENFGINIYPDKIKPNFDKPWIHS